MPTKRLPSPKPGSRWIRRSTGEVCTVERVKRSVIEVCTVLGLLVTDTPRKTFLRNYKPVPTEKTE